MHRPRWSMDKDIGWLVMAALFGLLVRVHPTPAADFACAAGDVACLISAINAANANGEANTITLAAGTYTLTTVDNDTDGPNGLPSITSPLTITGARADTTILERTASAPSFRLVHVAASGNLTLTGLVLRGGLSFGGGGLLNAGGTVTITDSTLAQNSAAAGSGAAGGGLYSDGGTVTLRNSTLTSNHGSSGGGLLIARGMGTITNTTIVGNQGGYFGGGLYTYRATVTITNNAVNGNTASLSGGGLYIAGGSLVTITNSTVAGNQTLVSGSRGGGLYVGDTSTVTITNSTLAHNAAGTLDGTAGSGGGLFSAGSTVTLQNTVLAGNYATTSPDCAGPVTSLGHNLVGNPTGCTMTLLSP